MKLMRFVMLLALMACGTCVLAAVDLSTPKAAAKSFYEAMQTADAAAMRDLMLTQNDGEKQLAGAFVDVILAGKKLADTAKDKFGAAGEKMAPLPINKEEADRIDAAQQQGSGDEVTLQFDSTSKPMKFHKTEAGWKLVVTDYAGAQAQDISEQVKLLTNLAAAMNDTSDDIAQGRFPASADAEAAIQQRFSEALARHYHPATTRAAQ